MVHRVMRLQDWLTEKKWTAADLAAALNTTPQAAGRYLSGQRMPTALTLEQIIKVTDGAVTAQDMHEQRMAYVRGGVAA